MRRWSFLVVLLLLYLTLDLGDPTGPGACCLDAADLYFTRMAGRAAVATPTALAPALAPRGGAVSALVRPAVRSAPVERPRPVTFRSRAALSTPAPSDAGADDH